MKFEMQVRHKDEKASWREEMDYPEVSDNQTAEKRGREIVEHYNSTLRPKELPREFISARIIGEGEIDHDWEKQNLVTIIKGSTCFDNYKCLACGCEGRRYGLSEDIIRTGKWKPMKYCKCHPKQ